jgi:peptide/nickel transport system ATP-binding protein
MAYLEIRNLHLAMRTFEGEAHVLNGVDLSVERGEIWGLVGETGCGKSLTGLSVSRLVSAPPGRYLAGSIRVGDTDILGATEAEMRRLRGRHIGMIFQDPTTNLNPVFRVSEQMVDVALHAAQVDHAGVSPLSRGSPKRRKVAARELCIAMLEEVGIPEAARRIDDYPHQFSGGMRQRVLIAMALLGHPELLIADEPTTALDVSVQAQILALIHRLVRKHNLAVLMITHNFGVVAQLCSHVAVMYAGNIVEKGRAIDVLKRPVHPYTRALLAAVPRRGTVRGELKGLAGSVPDLVAPPCGCRLAPRCEFARAACLETVPPFVEVSTDHAVACINAGGQ